MPVSAALKHYLSHLSIAERLARSSIQDWKAMIDRISTPGVIAEIDKEIYWYFLEALPPHFQSGRVFAFAEGAEPLRLFWQNGDCYFCRQLTWEETRHFCRLAGIALPT